MYLPGSLMVEVAGGHGSCGVVADREPCLGDRGERQIVGGPGSAHLGGHPARFEGIGQYGWPAAGDGEGQDDVEQLAVRVGLCSVPAPSGPLRVGQAGVAATVHAGAEVNQAGGR